MKKLLVTLLLSVASLCSAALGAPFLVCDSVTPTSDPSLTPVSYNLTGLAANTISTPAHQNTDGTIQLHYDLATLANGSYTVSASAVNTFGNASAASAALTFTKGAPGTPQNLRISPN